MYRSPPNRINQLRTSCNRGRLTTRKALHGNMCVSTLHWLAYTKCSLRSLIKTRKPCTSNSSSGRSFGCRVNRVPCAYHTNSKSNMKLYTRHPGFSTFIQFPDPAFLLQPRPDSLIQRHLLTLRLRRKQPQFTLRSKPRHPPGPIARLEILRPRSGRSVPFFHRRRIMRLFLQM